MAQTLFAGRLKGITFEYMIPVSQIDPSSESPGSKEFAEWSYFLFQ